MAGSDTEETSDTGYGEASQYAAHLDRGWALLDRGDLDAARTSVSHAQGVRPEDPDALVLQGAIALAEGKPRESLRCYERALELDPEYLEPYVAAAHLCLYDLDQPRRALRLCEDALELEGLAPFETLDLVLVATEAELVISEPKAGQARLTSDPQIALVEAALELAAGLKQPMDHLTDEDPAWAEAARFLALDHDGEPLEDDERAERVVRIQHYSARLSRLLLDLGEAEEGLRLLNRIVALFPEDADAWYLCSEAEHRHGKARNGADAALRTLELDSAVPLPRFVEAPAVVQHRITAILQGCGVTEIAAMAEPNATFAILVRQSPPAELVAEGVDPRVCALALTARPSSTHNDEAVAAASVTGIVVYLRNICRFTDNADTFEQELKFAVLEELATALALPDGQRAALGLPTEATGYGGVESHQPDPSPNPSSDPTTSEESAEDPSNSSRRRRRGSRALN